MQTDDKVEILDDIAGAVAVDGQQVVTLEQPKRT